ncbi:MAG: benzoate/H(+) symporter BenE family transporter [Paracoccaceae bacterium]
MRASLVSAAFVAALVGYGSTIALVLAAAAAVGADAGQTSSWVLAVCLGKAAGSALLSTWHRVPVVLAWSTPGAALVATTEGLTFHQAVGAFVITGVLIALTGAVRPLGRLVGMIPDGIAGGMLAGVLLPFVLKGAGAADTAPALVLPMVAVFALVRLWNPAVAVIAALACGLGLAFATGFADWPALTLPLPRLEFIAPIFDLGAIIGLALPLYLVTMASQNLPGFATMRAAGYEPPVRSALGVTGGISAITALFGAHTVSMAAITAAICLGQDVHPDRDQRWKVGLAYAGFWVLLGLCSPAILLLLAALPPQVMTALVALALLGALTGALATAMAEPRQRFAAVLTLGVTASGVPFLGVGAAFWGLVVGIGFFALERLAARRG